MSGALGVLIAGFAGLLAEAQPPPDDSIALGLPEDMELELLVGLASDTLGVQVLYDETLASKRLTIKAPERIPRASLLPLLESAVRTWAWDRHADPSSQRRIAGMELRRAGP